MKIEVIKSYALFILVGLSLILTYNIWTYKPGFDVHQDKDRMYVSEDDLFLAGDTLLLEDVIIPNDMIFHDQGDFFGFQQANDLKSLYREIGRWTIYEFSTGDSTGPPKQKRQIEIRYPTPLPMKIIPRLFTFDKELKNLPSWSFDRVFITFDKNHPMINLQFLSIDGKQKATAVIQQAEKYELLLSYMENKVRLQEYIAFKTKPDWYIYIPNGKVEKAKKSFSVDVAALNQAPNKLINALFSDPSIVTRNLTKANVANYTDGRQQLQIDSQRLNMEFTNPSQMDIKEPLHSVELLEKTVDNINEHKGWTGEFHLESIDSANQKVTFLMYQNGEPILSNNRARLEQEWRKQVLFKYERPLFQISDLIVEEMTELPSGEEIIQFINQSQYNLKDIQDIRVGYRLKFQDMSSYIFTLEPAWFMKYNGAWVEIQSDKDISKEVS
ncbi:MAG TPA: two-component system activity regulator YycH [Cerasibacillus sp.]|uniref:YycH family regulatory protein n=1 Tax=Cerasibacillus sp. TaxID=2498711 RepID=UPI002F410958